MEADMIRYLIKNNLKIMFRSPVNIIMYVLCPIIVSAVIMSAFSAVFESYEGPEEFTVGYTIDTESQLNAYIDTSQRSGRTTESHSRSTTETSKRVSIKTTSVGSLKSERTVTRSANPKIKKLKVPSWNT